MYVYQYMRVCHCVLLGVIYVCISFMRVIEGVIYVCISFIRVIESVIYIYMYLYISGCYICMYIIHACH